MDLTIRGLLQVAKQQPGGLRELCGYYEGAATMEEMAEQWVNLERPGYFGRRRDEKVAALNAQYGEGNWRLVWIVKEGEEEKAYSFAEACEVFYEEAYYLELREDPGAVDFICTFGECQDNAPSNYLKGDPAKFDYEDQEAFSTHIQDIAVRRVLRRLKRDFDGSQDNILTIRSADSNGYRFGPGNIPFHRPELITQPEIRPKWAGQASVEAFWQSNKWIQVRAHLAPPRPTGLRIGR